MRRNAKMFDNNVKTEAIPERVFELCSVVAENTKTDSVLKEMFEPGCLPVQSTTPYYSTVREAAIELGLIAKNGNEVSFVGDKKAIKSLDSFRYYCNSVVWKNRNVLFYKLAQTILNSNDEYWGDNLTSPMNISKIRSKVSPMTLTETMLLGERFWLQFLGFGYVQEKPKIIFLPNMYIALKDFMRMCVFEVGKEYSVKDFVQAVSEKSRVAFEGAIEHKQFNMAVSNALRQLENNGEIELLRHLDSKEVWNLYKLETKNITEITHIKYRGLAK